MLTDINEPELVSAGEEIGCETMKLDVRLEGDWSRLKQLHPVADVVVNNAGVTGFETSTSPQDPENANLEDWRAVALKSIWTALFWDVVTRSRP